ncbi:hypothetical protein OBBRIDRAFT_826734 [Obba rivulosa]|uniref:Uncharacterized protein n=1 Tax=Obba rivulosa TaxID=1052685 RepID=A0A8E2ARP3_9APHY|nr:hypothetical protein OBBRIDRAFT_826734 [Obba rivulosa]
MSDIEGGRIRQASSANLLGKVELRGAHAGIGSCGGYGVDNGTLLLSRETQILEFTFTAEISIICALRLSKRTCVNFHLGTIQSVPDGILATVTGTSHFNALGLLFFIIPLILATALANHVTMSAPTPRPNADELAKVATLGERVFMNGLREFPALHDIPCVVTGIAARILSSGRAVHAISQSSLHARAPPAKSPGRFSKRSPGTQREAQKAFAFLPSTYTIGWVLAVAVAYSPFASEVAVVLRTSQEDRSSGSSGTSGR